MIRMGSSLRNLASAWTYRLCAAALLHAVQVQAAEQTRPPASAAARAKVELLERELAAIQSKDAGANWKRESFARVRGKIEPVEDEAWPEGAETAYVVVRDTKGRVRFLDVEPVSESGDWSFETTFLFDEAGRTVVFQRNLGDFAECGLGLVKETLTRYFEAGGKELAQTYERTTENGQPVLDERCVKKPLPHTVYRTLAEALARTGLRTVVH